MASLWDRFWGLATAQEGEGEETGSQGGDMRDGGEGNPAISISNGDAAGGKEAISLLEGDH